MWRSFKYVQLLVALLAASFMHFMKAPTHHAARVQFGFVDPKLPDRKLDP